jgi:MFS family permease
MATTDAAPPPDPGFDPRTGRPTEHLPTTQLLRISLYWLGLSSIFAGLTIILGGRLIFDGLVEDQVRIGEALIQLTFFGSIIAIVVQPTVGAISDYTASRWGRRKPYIFVGTILDFVFILGIALSSEIIAIAAFIALLQFSSNVAQGPFQGYIPDLVPGPQVGVASALVGMMQVFGNVTGFVIASVAVATDQFALGLIALGVVELVTMLAVVIRVRDGRPPKPRASRSWLAVARSAWATDILRERSFMWLLGSRLTILMAGGILTGLGIIYIAESLEYAQDMAGLALIPVVGLVAVGTVVSVLPAARLSDRVGRKKVIWGSCALGAIGLGLVATAPLLADTPAEILARADGDDGLIESLLADPRYYVALAGAVIYGLSAGAFLAVDWALITDIIPKASSGRYMGISNVATASAGIFAIALGGLLLDRVTSVFGDAAGPVAAMWLAVVLIIVGGVLLIPVDERRRTSEVGPLPTEEPGAEAV